MELGPRSLSFSALGLLTLVPLLIIVSSADPEHGRGFAQWLGEGLGVSTAARGQVERLFTRPGQALRSTTVFGIAALALFGLAFGAAVQTGYEKVWDLPPDRWWARWRHVVWLSVLTAYLFASATTTLRPEPLAGGAAASLSAVLFLWWSQHLLLGGRIRWRALLPGALATVFGLLGLRIFSALVFSPLIASNAVTYGPVGTFLVVESWLLGVGVVIFGGALLGRSLYEELPPRDTYIETTQVRTAQQTLPSPGTPHRTSPCEGRRPVAWAVRVPVECPLRGEVPSRAAAVIPPSLQGVVRLRDHGQGLLRSGRVLPVAAGRGRAGEYGRKPGHLPARQAGSAATPADGIPSDRAPCRVSGR
ncbi:Uncharacterized membrane protein, BrkB/YihY/UPF0761 family (not an RNase) [Streptomyces prasinopilosus]|uniref:Uncharacterized membrane protein, BrkB/YihY/UPF0761 family (Not an RNase) n=1 Tax=Streptomyces prasinopilosus TaxID=67344 RepID=A0A1G6V8J5_9ACTN|nr:Uncharacterized membrane protein, BrkB/YihY/UPF0761 family (not an RNase) [Streptomyces prasinopilosus]